MEILYAFPEPFPISRARGVQVAHFICALASQGVTVYFAYVPADDAIDPFSSYGLKKPDTVRFIPLSRNLCTMQSNRLFFWRLKRWLKNVSKMPECVIVRHIKLAYFLLCGFPRLPLVYEAHEVSADVAPEDKRAKLHKMEDMVLQKASMITAISLSTVKKLKERYLTGRDIFVLPNGVNVPDLLAEKPWTEAHRNIIYAGSLFDWKGVHDLVEAGQWLSGFKITIIGGEPHQIEKLREHVHPGGAEIVFLGHLPHQETIAALNGSCIAILPNRNISASAFTSPLKLFEYMASGCAIVASDIPPLREILEDDDAIWFEPGNPHSLAYAIKKLTSAPETAKQNGDKLRRKAYDYTWESRARKQIDLIKEKILHA